MKGMDRILAAIGVKNIVEILSSEKLTWTGFHTLLLHILEKRIGNVSPADIMKNYGQNRFSAIADVNPKELLEIDRTLYSVLPANFLAVELSPVNAIGANTALTPLDPKVVLSTIRNMEVVGDPSMALAIECAHRRKSLRATKESSETHLATSHRVLRLQNFPKNSGLTSHFRSFALASAARDVAGFNKFELSSLSAHIEAWLDFLASSSDIGYKAQKISVAVSDIGIAEKLISDGRINKEEVRRKAKDQTWKPFKAFSIDLPCQIDHARDIPITYPELETYIRELRFTEKQIVDPLRIKYPSVHFCFDLERCTGAGYYSGLCYRVTAENPAGTRHSLAGGGACDWTRKLLQSKKEHLVASGFGTELFSKLFKQLG